ncbi:hypothetical protein BSZ32_08670 [Rubritalea profundi]|uniref:Uncharacterized protein n=1 Tax=Rubritalea profundi TaxID=1658618 RepID=A0A2S7U0Q6_9BACT|nr:hypothetical protein BSZ32_08670 [Rubritalea profundi]
MDIEPECPIGADAAVTPIELRVVYLHAGSTESAELGAQHGTIEEGNAPKALRMPKQARPATTHVRTRWLECFLVGLLGILMRGECDPFIPRKVREGGL